VSDGAARSAAHLPSFDNGADVDIGAFALRMRSYFGISVEDQQESRDAKAFYNLCRKKIEDKGIFVIQESFPATDGSGFCLAHPRYPIIVVNTKQQSRGRRLFTLIHELAHVLMGQSGISDPFISRNRVERQCNRFAASFLVPQSFVQALLRRHVPADPTTDDVRLIAGRLKISQEAAVLRLEQLGLFSKGTHETWKSQFSNSGENPDFSDKGGGGGTPPPQEKVKLAKYGFRLAAASEELLAQERASEIDVYRFSGIKPKYLHAYLQYANSITSSELRALELDDD
jgi:Zn-dependent peptidase ImmA (M78 family)